MNIAPATTLSDEAVDAAIEAAPEREHSVWSVLEVVDQMDSIATVGTGLTMVYAEYWPATDSQARPGKPLTVALPDDPTWHDLHKAADELIRQSGDEHHVFIENFDRVGPVLTLWTGS